MKILIFSDLHLSDQSRDLAEILLQEIVTKEVDVVFHLGDLFEYKDQIPNHLQKMVIDFVDSLVKNNKMFVTLFGNHDGFFKDLPSMLYLKHFGEKVCLITEPTVLFDQFGFIPYNEDIEELKNQIQSLDCPYCCIHADIAGFVPKAKLQPSVFQKFKLVFAGHIHQPQKKQNILCVGSPFAKDFRESSPVNKPIDRGYYIFDVAKKNISFVKFDAPYYVKIEKIEDIKIFKSIYAGKKVNLWLDLSETKNIPDDFSPVEVLTKIITQKTEDVIEEDNINFLKWKNLEDYLKQVVSYQKNKERLLFYGKKILRRFGVEL